MTGRIHFPSRPPSPRLHPRAGSEFVECKSSVSFLVLSSSCLMAWGDVAFYYTAMQFHTHTSADKNTRGTRSAFEEKRYCSAAVSRHSMTFHSFYTPEATPHIRAAQKHSSTVWQYGVPLEKNARTLM